MSLIVDGSQYRAGLKHGRVEGRIAGLKEAADIALARTYPGNNDWCRGHRSAQADIVHDIQSAISALESTPNPLTNQFNPPTEEC